MPSTISLYYKLKPIIPRRLQIFLRRIYVQLRLHKFRNRWPIDEETATLPNDWTGWPNNMQFAFILFHDVDTLKGYLKCKKLIEIEKDIGFRSSFNFVAEGYPINEDFLQYIKSNGFEVGIHGLIHDQKFYSSYEIFTERAAKINKYIKKWKVDGFSSPCMFHNLDWTGELDVLYDISTFDTDPFEPQPDGVKTIFPFLVNRKDSKANFIELPYTLPQDFTLFVLLKEKNIDIWKKKLDWIAEKGGMALLNTHTDYMNFGNYKVKFDEYPVDYYQQFLRYVQDNYKDLFWHVLPADVARFCLKMTDS